MQITQIQIRTTDARLGLTIQKPTQEIRQPKADVTIEQPKAVQDIQITRGKLSIDASEARAQYGFKSIPQLSAENAQNGRQAVQEGTARRAQQGRALMRIQDGGSPIAQHAKQQTTRQPKGLAIGFIPSHGSVKIDYTPAQVDIRHDPQKPVITVQPNRPVHNYTPGSVTTELTQYPSIEFSI